MGRVYNDVTRTHETAKEIMSIAEEYKTIGYALMSDISIACDRREGSSKDAFMRLINQNVEEHVCFDIPRKIYSMAEVLQTISHALEEADYNIAAELIPEKIIE